MTLLLWILLQFQHMLDLLAAAPYLGQDELSKPSWVDCFQLEAQRKYRNRATPMELQDCCIIFQLISFAKIAEFVGRHGYEFPELLTKMAFIFEAYSGCDILQRVSGFPQ
jgi:hypothetical protein